VQGSMQIGRYKRFMQIANQFISNTGYETQCSTKGKSYRFSPLETPSALCPPQEAGFTLNQIISTTGFEAPCSTKGKSYRFSPLETPSALCPPQEAGFTLNQIISTTGYETPCSTKGKSYCFSPLWSNGPRLHEGKPHLPAQAGRSYARGKPRGILRMKKSF